MDPRSGHSSQRLLIVTQSARDRGSERAQRRVRRQPRSGREHDLVQRVVEHTARHSSSHPDALPRKRTPRSAVQEIQVEAVDLEGGRRRCSSGPIEISRLRADAATRAVATRARATTKSRRSHSQNCSTDIVDAELRAATDPTRVDRRDAEAQVGRSEAVSPRTRTVSLPTRSRRPGAIANTNSATTRRNPNRVLFTAFMDPSPLRSVV